MIRDFTDDFLRDLVKAVDDGLGSAALEGEESASASMPGAGAQAIGANARGEVASYRASTPGNPPGVRSGRLRASVSSARLQPGVWGFGTNVRYGRTLELGGTTPGGQPFFKDKDGNIRFASRSSPHAWRMAKTKAGTIAPRPFLRPVLVRDRERLQQAFTRAASRSLARAVTARAAGGAA